MDFLTGGADADMFVYQIDSSTANFGLDTITDFELGVDHLDVDAGIVYGLGYADLDGDTVNESSILTFTSSGGANLGHVIFADNYVADVNDLFV